MTKSYSGQCFCGTVTVSVEGEPIAQGFCHCNDCRDWSATPVTGYALWPMDLVTVTRGAEKVTRFDKEGKATRCSCAVCGGAVMTELAGAGLADVYPMFLKDFDFEPQAHVYYAERILDMADGLPKFKDLPAEAGGSGDMET